MANDLDLVRSKMPWLVQLGIWETLHWFNGLEGREKMDLIAKILDYMLKLDFMNGYRTYAAGAGSALSGLALIALAAANDPHGDVKTGIELLVAGVGLIGHRGAQEKIIEAAKQPVKLALVTPPKP